jgi:hypothetical protein
MLFNIAPTPLYTMRPSPTFGTINTIILHLSSCAPCATSNCPCCRALVDCEGVSVVFLIKVLDVLEISSYTSTCTLTYFILAPRSALTLHSAWRSCCFASTQQNVRNYDGVMDGVKDRVVGTSVILITTDNHRSVNIFDYVLHL